MIKATTQSRSHLLLGLPTSQIGVTRISRGVVVVILVVEWGLRIISRVARIFILMLQLLGRFSVGQGIRLALVKVNVKVSITLSMDLSAWLTFQLDYIHWITQTPTNLQAFGLCSKDSWSALRLADGTNLLTANGYTGSWPGGGGDVGRYTP